MPNVFVIVFCSFYVFFLLLSVISQSSAAATAPKRAVYIVEHHQCRLCRHVQCPVCVAMPPPIGWPLHELTSWRRCGGGERRDLQHPEAICDCTNAIRSNDSN
jgi:hypothetical protein